VDTAATEGSERSEVLFVGGRSGAGKSSAALALHSLLSELHIKHSVIEGDYLDLAWPAPWEHQLAEKNLAAVWRNYRELGYRRLIYTNTASVLRAPALALTMGDDPLVHAVLLSASDQEVRRRLSKREFGDEIERHVERSIVAAGTLEREADPRIPRINTDGRSPAEIATLLLELTGWGSRIPLTP
jgi:ABC-type ATPase involved in cell division